MKDLTLDFDGKVVNMRVVVLLKTPNGYVFERSKDGYVFPLGGRIRWGETTLEAAKRELMEEVNLEDLLLNPLGYIENFFKMKDKDCHELSFVYTAEVNDLIDVKALQSESEEDNDGYVIISKDDLNKFDIRPRVVPEMIISEEEFQVCVVRD